MRFTVIGHACVFIETGAQRILVDPRLLRPMTLRLAVRGRRAIK